MHRHHYHSFWIFFILAVLLLCAGCAPAEGEDTGAPPPASEPTEGETGGIIPEETAVPVTAGILEQRLLVLEWPRAIRAGDADVVRLTLAVDPEGNITPTAQLGEHEVRGEAVFIEDVYATHHVVAEAGLQLAGVEVSPSGQLSEALRPGQATSFMWSVRPREVGTYRGAIQLHLNYIPIDGGQAERSLLAAPLVEIRAVNLLGLGGTPARVLGGVGVLLGSVIGLDNVLPWVWKFVRGRLPSRQ